MTVSEWPASIPRTPVAERVKMLKYSMSLADAVEAVETELDRLDPDSRRVGFGNQHSKSNGMPLYNANPDDPGFVVRWVVDEETHAVAADGSTRLRDNVREVGEWLKETRMRSNRSVSISGDEYASARLPPGEGGEEAVVVGEPPAHEVLGVPPEAGDAEVREAYQDRVFDCHPDHDGSAEAYQRLNRAREQMLDGGVR